MDRGAVDITERWLESYVPGPDVERVKLWDARLTGFGVVIGRRHRTLGRDHDRQRLVLPLGLAPARDQHALLLAHAAPRLDPIVSALSTSGPVLSCGA